MVDNTPRNPTAASQRSSGKLAAKPVLARMPDVAAEAELLRVANKSAAGVGYRFDPPQAEKADAASSANTLKSELVYLPRTAPRHQPHVFDRNRATERRSTLSRRQSPVLPHNNSFAIPRRGLLDSIAPVVRFVTLVALFTFAGTWIQLVGFRGGPGKRAIELPTTTVQEPPATSTKTAERPAAAPTSSGPTRSTPESNTRVGRVRDDNGFARLQGGVLPAPSVGSNTPSPEVASVGGALPRVRTTESQAAENLGGGSAPTGEGDAPALARRLPEFPNDIPSR